MAAYLVASLCGTGKERLFGGSNNKMRMRTRLQLKLGLRVGEVDSNWEFERRFWVDFYTRLVNSILHRRGFEWKFFFFKLKRQSCVCARKSTPHSVVAARKKEMSTEDRIAAEATPQVTYILVNGFANPVCAKSNLTVCIDHKRGVFLPSINIARQEKTLKRGAKLQADSLWIRRRSWAFYYYQSLLLPLG